MKTINFNEEGGICVKLHGIARIYPFVQKNFDNEELEVVWRWDARGTPEGGEFYDFFENIPRLKFVKESKNSFYYNGHGVGKYEKLGIPHEFDYSIIKPKQEVLDILKTESDKLDNNYIAIHIRRTDLKQIKRGELDGGDYSMYHNLIDKHPDKNLYVASDNESDYERFFEKYKSSRKINQNVNFLKTKYRRNTSALDAIIDLYMCINAYDFCGTKFSSFSSYIRRNRGETF